MIAIRQQQQFEGNRIGGTEHKVLLYAVDAVFLMSNPEKYLRVLKKMLNAYGEVSGYRVNEMKSVIMGMNVGADMRKP